MDKSDKADKSDILDALRRMTTKSDIPVNPPKSGKVHFAIGDGR